MDSDRWELKDLTDYGKKYGNKYMTIALECGITFYERGILMES